MSHVQSAPKPLIAVPDPVREIAVSPGQTLLAFASVNRDVYLLKNGEVIRKWNMLFDDERMTALDIVRSLGFSADGSILFVANGTILRGMDVVTGEQVWQFECPPVTGFLNVCPHSLSVAKSGRFAVVRDDAVVMVWDQFGFPESVFSTKDLHLNLQLSENGEQIMMAGGFEAKLCDITGEAQHNIVLKERCYAAEWLESANLVACRSTHSITIHTFGQPNPLLVIPTAPGSPSLASSNERHEFAYADELGVHIIGTDLQQRTLENTPRGVICLQYQGDQLLVGTANGHVVVLPLPNAVHHDSSKYAVGAITHSSSKPRISSETAMRIGAAVAHLISMSVMFYFVDALVCAPMRFNLWQRIFSDLFLGFCLSSPSLFVGMTIGWFWAKRNSR